MAEEFSRTTARKRITLPSGDQVDVPVITKLSVIDPVDRYQETQFTIDNSAASTRKVHVDQVQATNNSSQTIDVERIDEWQVADAVERGQETFVKLDNVTGADSIPPHFETHFKTHVVRYYGVTNQSAYIDSELIDEIRVIDPNDRYQESWLVLNNPPTSAEAQANPEDPNIADTDNGIDPAWRTDPFQNIIGFSGTVPPDEHFDAVFIVHQAPGYPSGRSYSGGWRIEDVTSVVIEVAAGRAYYAGNNPTAGTGDFPGHFPGDYDFDFRFVDQYFEPHTYGTETGTGDVKGYTRHEWEVGFSVSDPYGWWPQLQAYFNNPTDTAPPNAFDAPSYGIQAELKAAFDTWYDNSIGGASPTANPRPVFIVRLAVVGNPTTDHPNGRF